MLALSATFCVFGVAVLNIYLLERPSALVKQEKKRISLQYALKSRAKLRKTQSENIVTNIIKPINFFMPKTETTNYGGWHL